MRRRPKPYDPATVREFQLIDGRPIALHRHGIRFATPLKEDPERATLVGIMAGKSPLPLSITYASFMAWWLKTA